MANIKEVKLPDKMNTDEYSHGYYDATVDFHKTELKASEFVVNSLDTLSVLRVPETRLERSKLFCLIRGLDLLYNEYWLSIQLANRRAKGWGYWGRLWNALNNRNIVVLEAEPKSIWMEQVAREFSEAFRQARLVVDISIQADYIGGKRELLFEARTWRENSPIPKGIKE